MTQPCTPNIATGCSRWVLAMRPKTLPAGAVPVLVGAIMAFEVTTPSPFTIGLILLSALAIQIATNLANDLCDFKSGADSSSRTGPLRVTQAGLVTESEMKLAIALVVLFALLCGIPLVFIGGLPILLIGLLSILCALGYTAGPYPLAYTGLGDLFVLIFFGPVAVGGTHYILTHNVTMPVLLIGLAVGMISTAILVVNNLRDYNSDKQCGKLTLAVKFGKSFSKAEYCFLLCGAALIPLGMLLFESQHSWIGLAALFLIPASKTMQQVICEEDPEVLNDVLADTGKLLVIFGCLFSIGWL
ncbi:1,4-dihydroxy-2-naphthoate polyprenyltransferase, partial [Oligoflexia bacterium]|nr:1,4-dihydroxy-2-naphthoate polyprenyltransferase [Oligoflexia bacterium]